MLREHHRAPEGGLPQLRQPGAVSSPSDCIRTDETVVAGFTLVPEQVVAFFESAYEGRYLGLTELNEVLKQLSFLYVEKGFYVKVLEVKETIEESKQLWLDAIDTTYRLNPSLPFENILFYQFNQLYFLKRR